MPSALLGVCLISSSADTSHTLGPLDWLELVSSSELCPNPQPFGLERPGDLARNILL